MEWVETTARTVEEAKELALDQLGVVAADAEFDVLAEPKQGLFGRLRGEARVRARIRPTPARPKQERRRGRKPAGPADASPTDNADEERAGDAVDEPSDTPRTRSGRRRSPSPRSAPPEGNGDTTTSTIESTGGPVMTNDERADVEPDQPSEADVASVRDAAVAFVGGLSTAFGFDGTVTAAVEGSEIEVHVDGSSLGLLIGPGGRTLLAIQDLARVAAQRRLGDHETRLRIDVAGYREKRRQALERFATTVADQVKETGVARSLDPMPSADRKILHDVLSSIDGVTTRSEGEDPNRRVVVAPS